MSTHISTGKIEKETTTAAMSILIHFGAHIHHITDGGKDKVKRRVRPMLGRGDYGQSLMAHFTRKQLAEIQSKKAK